MKNTAITIARTLAFTVAAWALSLPAAAQATQEVWQHHIDAWVDRDLDAIAADYDQTSIMIINNKIFRGREQIRSVFAQLFKIFDDGQNTIDPATLVSDYIFLTWAFQPTGHTLQPGTDTFVIRDGVIVLQTIASPLYELFPIELE